MQTVLEAINLHAGSQAAGKFWLGGQQSQESGNIIKSLDYPYGYPRNYDEVIVNSVPCPNIFHNLGAGMAAASSKWIHTVGF